MISNDSPFDDVHTWGTRMGDGFEKFYRSNANKESYFSEMAYSYPYRVYINEINNI